MPLALGDVEDVKIGSSALAGAQGFDWQTAQTLFWKPVPVQLRQADREDQNEELTFRILSGVSRANHNMRVRGLFEITQAPDSARAFLIHMHCASCMQCVMLSLNAVSIPCHLHTMSCYLLQILRIHISSESDLFFLHSLEVSEDDFQTLKTEQGILVDFSSFPGKVITLLDKCISSLPTDAPRYEETCACLGVPCNCTCHVVSMISCHCSILSPVHL